MISQQQETQRAEQMVERFVRRFQLSYKLLACHAALPLVLTPELLNFLRVQFLRGEVPPVAEVDLLLSDLCRQVGYELYAMDTAVRAYLLEEMKREFGDERMQEVARLLISYVKYIYQNNPYISPKELQAQQWAAMVYIEPETAAREIAQDFQSTAIGRSLVNRAEIARLAKITQELAPQLHNYAELVRYAELVSQVLIDASGVEESELRRSYIVGGVELSLPEELMPPKILTAGLGLQSLLQHIQATGDRNIQVTGSGNITQESSSPNSIPGFPPLQTFQFRIPSISLEGETETPGGINLQTFTFEAATIELKKSKGNTELIINRRRQQNQYFSEDLGNGVELEMVKIPGGTFTMGAPKKEKDSRGNERPQHQVTVPTFFMGKYPITQAQWRVVANMQHLRVNRDLKPEPSRFKGDNRPVEKISWYDAVEFCGRLSRIAENRLSQDTGKQYRLPSEAEWEFACRAGTTTPFHFGETITSELANYNATYTYGAGSKGIYHKETTPVDSFDVANAFGLYDMHGNVLEWCLDDWHNNYEGAPTNGSAWVKTENRSKNNNRYQVLRGGSWNYYPGNCRSAYRNDVRVERDYVNINLGFRVVCGVGQ
ncbi:MAG: formylglycine-generating enzyme family protein [Nostocales cyanobacterium 94392]|nr:formylglycine-generating enzyme family protein [Nostocales cyanobacterium 94392]